MRGRVAVGLAVAWLVVPAVQYVATVQRSRLQLGESAPLEWLASVDLTPVYALLLVATLLFAVLTAMAGRHSGPPHTSDQEGVP